MRDMWLFGRNLKIYNLNRIHYPTASIIIIIIIIIIPCEFFTPALADGSSLELEWQQVSNLQDFSQYSGRSLEFCSLGGLYLSSGFLVFQFFQ